MMLTLPPAAFDDDRADLGLVRRKALRLGGDSAHAHASTPTRHESRTRPTRRDAGRRQATPVHGLALALLGDRAAAAREGEHGLRSGPCDGRSVRQDPLRPSPAGADLCDVGDHPHALDQLEALLAKPYFVSPAWLSDRPDVGAAEADPRFERIVATRLPPVA